MLVECIRKIDDSHEVHLDCLCMQRKINFVELTPEDAAGIIDKNVRSSSFEHLISEGAHLLCIGNIERVSIRILSLACELTNNLWLCVDNVVLKN